MTKVEYSVEIAAPLQEVFAFVSDPLNDPEWETALLSGQTLGSREAADSKLTNLRKLLLGPRFEATAEIAGLEPNSRIDVRGASGPLPFEGSWTFEPAGEGTKVTFTGEVRGSGLKSCQAGFRPPAQRRRQGQSRGFEGRTGEPEIAFLRRVRSIPPRALAGRRRSYPRDPLPHPGFRDPRGRAARRRLP